MVLAIVGLASAGVSLALRDGAQSRLEREALRLGALLEAARARSQALGVPLRWQAVGQGFVIGSPNAAPDAAEPPLRIFFGNGPLAVATRDYEQRLATWKAWEGVSIAAQGAPR